MRSRASSFKWEYPLLSPRSSSNFLRLLVTSIRPSIFPSITSFRRQFLRKIWPIQLALRNGVTWKNKRKKLYAACSWNSNGVEEDEKKQSLCVCVCERERESDRERKREWVSYKQHMGGADKDKLLLMFLVDRKRMNKWHMKLFRRLLNITSQFWIL
jgi:hypothetical protein